MEILVKDDPVFRNIHQKYVDSSTDKKMRMADEAREKKRKDEIFLLSSAEQRGREKGEEIGKEKGRKEALYQIVTTMQQNGMDAAHIQKLTGLSQQEIERILCSA